MKFIIYSLKCISNQRAYVGRTSRPVKWRVMEHFKGLERNRHKNKPLQDDFNRYGKDAFAVDILETITGENDCGAERRWMLALKTNNPEYGYNARDPYFGLNRKKVPIEYFLED